MSTERHEIWQLLDAIQMDIRAAGTKMVALRAHVAGLDLPDPTSVKCPHCDLQLKGPRTLAEHLHVSHDGPVPEHLLAAEELIDPESEAA